MQPPLNTNSKLELLNRLKEIKIKRRYHKTYLGGHLKLKLCNITFLVVFATLFLTSCGNQESDVVITVRPQSPLVINAKKIENFGHTDEIVYEPPWFQFHINVDNQSEETITIMNFQGKAVSFKNGKLNSDDIKFDLIDEPYLAQIQPKTKTSLVKTFIVDSLSQADSFTYSITLDVQGWYGDETNPKKRLDASFSFVTQ